MCMLFCDLFIKDLTIGTCTLSWCMYMKLCNFYHLHKVASVLCM